MFAVGEAIVEIESGNRNSARGEVESDVIHREVDLIGTVTWSGAPLIGQTKESEGSRVRGSMSDVGTEDGHWVEAGDDAEDVAGI